MDDLTRNKLVLVKQIHQQAILLSQSQYSVANRMMAVISFDLAAETILKAAYNYLVADQRKQPRDGFPEVLNQVEAAMKKKDIGNRVPARRQVLHVHGIRNAAQHEARYPNEHEVEECRLYARDFLEEMSQFIWGISLEDISLTDLVSHPTVKRLLKNAEAALSQANFERAVKYSNAALSWATEQVRKPLVNEPFILTSAHQRLKKQPHHQLADRPHGVDRELWESLFPVYQKTLADVGDVVRGLEEMMRAIEADVLRAHHILVMLTVGIDLADYHRFRRIAGHLKFTSRDEPKFEVTNVKDSLDQGEAEFVFDFCIDSVLQIESRAGDIDDPF